MNYRNMLFIPGHKKKYYSSAIEYNPDAIILDIEDGVPDNKKKTAINLINKKMKENFFNDMDVYIRINNETKNSMLHDLSKIAWKRITGIMLPMVQDKESIILLENFLANYEEQYSLPLQGISLILLIESPQGIINISELVSATSRVKALAFGSEDYCTLMKAKRTKNNLDYPRKIILTYARAHNLKCYDTVFPDLIHLTLLKKEAKLAFNMGFDGKLIIHPGQIQTINSEFNLSEKELYQIQQIILDFEELNDKGVMVKDGRIIERPHIERYKEILRNNNHY